MRMRRPPRVQGLGVKKSWSALEIALQFAPLRRMGRGERAAPEPCSWFRCIGPVPPALTAVGVPPDLVLGWCRDLATVVVPPYLAVLLGLSALVVGSEGVGRLVF
jgi:hypothetical protein